MFRLVGALGLVAFSAFAAWVCFWSAAVIVHVPHWPWVQGGLMALGIGYCLWGCGIAVWYAGGR